MRLFPGTICLLTMGMVLALATNNDAQNATTLVVTGSSMPEPLYKAWADAYHKENPEVTIRYLGVGTSESAHDVLRGSGDFGGGDTPIAENELAISKTPILQLPSVLIAIVVVYNLPQTSGELKLSGTILADIYLGRIKEWRDPAILKLNPELKIPALPIQVFHRNEGKGSNYIFSDFLSKTSPEFFARVGRTDSPKWPVGQSFQRSQDLHERVSTTPGAIGYTELNLAEQASLHIALIHNGAGEFIKATRKSVAAAALAANTKGQGISRASLTNSTVKGSYPISSYTWIYVPAVAKDAYRGQVIATFLRWVYGSGQTVAQELGYATLPPEALTDTMAKVRSLH